jgi:coenzyme F420 hydrogenase subunit beta
MAPDVISTIVRNNLCIGCGLCAAVCPERKLIMQFNRFGEYNPTQSKECLKDCGLCCKVCPFADGNDNEDSIGNTLFGKTEGISHRPETGYYLNCYVGYAVDTRERGASGGMATWLLSTLLKKGIVDFVIAVVPDDNPDQLFKYAILQDTESVLSSSGSAYYPVELSGVLQEIENKPGRCAIIGLPCFIKAIRLAMQKNRMLREKIHITAGIVCGQLKNKHFTDYISKLAGVRGDDLRKVHYRGKSPDTPASNYYYTFTRKNGTSERIFWECGISAAWMNRWFTMNACNYCDDIFAECADVTFMDAWLPEFSKESQGTNIVLVRSQLVQDIIDQGIKTDEVRLDPMGNERVIQSKAGVIDIKRRNLAYQLYLGHRQGCKMPKKRVAPTKLDGPFLREKIFLENQMQRVSREKWNPKDKDAERFKAVMRPYMVRLMIREQIHAKLIVFPLRTIQGIQKKIRGHRHE